MSIYVGIDPGKSGCFCLLIDNKPFFFDWPKNDDYYNYFSGILDFFVCNNYKIDLAVIEHAHAMPKQGVVSMFNFGLNYGLWRAFLALNEIDHQTVSPQKWRKTLGISKEKEQTTKEVVKNKVLELFPEQKDKLFTPRGKYLDGRGDALMLAEYARRIYSGT